MAIEWQDNIRRTVTISKDRTIVGYIHFENLAINSAGRELSSTNRNTTHAIDPRGVTREALQALVAQIQDDIEQQNAATGSVGKFTWRATTPPTDQ